MTVDIHRSEAVSRVRLCLSVRGE